MRSIFLLFPLLAALSVAPDLLAEAAPGGRSVVLVTLDGVRVEEVFGGLDEALAERDARDQYSEVASARERFGATTPQARRLKLWPHLWGRLVPAGVMLGNPAYGNPVRVQNKVGWSSPGYTELLTGRPRAEVVDNALVHYPYTTALEYAHQALGLEFQQTALIGAWDGFNTAAASRPDAFLMVGGHGTVPAPWSTPEIDRIAGLRANVMGLWEEGSDQWLTWAMGREYLTVRQPRILWLALGNTDDWAHADRYDRYLECLHQQDAILGELWDLLQSLDAYRGRTTLLVTTDHGRGRQGADWAEHDVSIPGSHDIWFFAIGPDTPATGEVETAGEAFLGQTAATLLDALGLDPDAWDSDALPPFPGVIARRSKDQTLKD